MFTAAQVNISHSHVSPKHNTTHNSHTCIEIRLIAARHCHSLCVQSDGIAQIAILT